MIQRIWTRHCGLGPVDIDYHGLKLRLIPDRNITDQKLLFRSGLRDAKDIEPMKEFAHANSVFWDIGANIGYYSLTAAKMGYGRLLAIEPNPILIERLAFNIVANAHQSRISLAPVAISDSPREMLLEADGDMGSGHGVKVTAESKGIPVKVERLADVIARENLGRVTAFKIDVEGHEDKALLPYLRSLSDADLPKLGIIEYVHSDEWSDDLIFYMLKRGYTQILRNRSNVILRRA